MRDLGRHKITTSEIEALLRKLAAEFEAEKRMGDMRPLLLRAAAQIVSRVEFPTFDLDNAR